MAETNALPDPQTAYNNLLMGVHQRLFFQKVAGAGMAPRSADEAHWMLDTAFKLRAAEESQAVKAAQAGNNPFYRMNQDLDAALSRHGLAPQRPEVELGVKQAAARLAQDPTIYNSVLALKVEEAAQFAGQAA